MDKVQVAVIGAGVVGLSTALCVAESVPNCSVTVIAEKFSPHTTSDVAAGILSPHFSPETPIARQRRWFEDTFAHIYSIAQSAEAPDVGVQFLSGLKKAGGQLQAGKVTDLWELDGKYDIVVNCSGIGARELTADMELYPVRGQVHKVYAPWLKHFVRTGDGTIYIYPGINSVTLGGTRQRGDWRLSVDPADNEAILEKCSAYEPSLKLCRKLSEGVALRPTRDVLRLEKEKLKRGGRCMFVVHNYGHGGTGVTFHWGTAKEAAQLVKEIIPEIRPRPFYTSSKL